jgi:hypothetical protein
MNTTIITAVVLVCVTVYLIVWRIYPSAGNQDVLDAQTPLNQKKNVLMPDRTQSEIVGSGGATVMGFFYVNQGDKTLRYGDSYVPLMEVEGHWAVEIVPSPREKEVGARLRIQTQQAGRYQSETVALPAFPKQRWVHLAVLREGRRFDVLYDGEIVASQRLEYYPAVVVAPLSIGNKGLDGAAIHLKVNGRRLSPEEVERERKTRVDTNGRVVQASSMTFPSVPMPPNPLAVLTAECPAGLPCETVTAPPKKPLYAWKTPYA